MNAHNYAVPIYYSPMNLLLPVLAALCVLGGGIALYVLFARRPNRWQGALGKLHDALSFETFYTEKLLRLLYCIVVVALAVISFFMLFASFFSAVTLFVIGNIVARVGFELALLLANLCRNTKEINQKMGPLSEERQTPAGPPSAIVPPQPFTPPTDES